MPLPAPVQAYLASEKIEYDITELALNQENNSQVTPSSSIATLVMLEDELGKAQVLIPQASLLNLPSLNEMLGRNWRAIMRTENAADSENQTPHQGILPLPEDGLVLVDQYLLKLDPIYLESGETNVLIKLSQKDFGQLTQGSIVDRYCKPIKTLIKATLDQENDIPHIHKALESFTTRRIKSRLNETLEIPPLPTSVEKVIRLRIEANATAEELAEVVAMDPGLAAQIISWAASPFYATPGKIRSIEDAIIRVLGFELVVNLAIGLAIGKTLQLPKDHPYNQSPYWEQAITTATVMERLSRLHPSKNRPARGLAYLSGLLHNFGYLVIGHAFPPHFSLLCRMIEANPHVPAAYIDQHLFGMTRDQIGSCLFESWSLPEEVIKAVRWQQLPSYQGPYASYANLLCLSQLLINEISEKPNSCLMTPRQTGELYERLGIEPDEAREIVTTVLAGQEELKSFSSSFR
ncbi:MAG: HDOD domain-containing protein [Pseudomonadales bacterium]|nr:HDOD domain-containing protein [Pseudomonadales bacterium]